VLSDAELVQELARARELVAQLEQALESRVVIEQAKGVLAERLGIPVDQAFDLLRAGARAQRIGLHDLAKRVVGERQTPMPIVIAISRESRLRTVSMRERAEAQREALSRLAQELERLRARLTERYGRTGSLGSD